jgi:hypothetical protein
MTLNLGVRYELDLVPYDQHGDYYNFDPSNGALVLPSQKSLNDISPVFNKMIPLELASGVGFPSKLVAGHHHNFFPRVGIAYRPFNDAKTVLRVAYGMYNVGYIGNGDLFSPHYSVNNGGPFALTESYTNTLTESGVPALSMPSPFPSAVGTGASTYSINAYNPNLAPGREQQWTAAIEHEVWGTALRLAYVGSLDTTQWSRNIDLPPPSTIPFDTSACGAPGPLPNATCRLNYYGFSSVNYTDNGGTSSYNALRFEFTRPMAKGLYLHGGYVWNRQIVGGDGTDPYDRTYTRSNMGGLPNQRFVIDWLYDIPVGRGRAFLSSPTSSRVANGFIQGVLGGWSSSAFLAFYGGTPYSVTYCGTDPSGLGQFCGNPDRIGSGRLANRTAGHEFDYTAFTVPASDIGRFGNSGTNILYTPGGQRFLLALYKIFDIHDRAKLRIGAYFNDPFNMKNIGSPDANISDTNSVGVATYGGNFGEVSRTLDMTARLYF